MSSPNGDLIRYPFPAQAPEAENMSVRPLPDAAVLTLRISRSEQIAIPHVTLHVILPAGLTVPEVVPTTGMSSTLDLFTARTVDAGIAPRNGRTYYTPLETAQVLGMPPEEVIGWAEIGLIPSRRARGEWRISAKWLDRYRPTAQAAKEMDTGLADEDLARLIRQGRRPWTWPTMQNAR